MTRSDTTCVSFIVLKSSYPEAQLYVPVPPTIAFISPVQVNLGMVEWLYNSSKEAG